jgi:tetratricopeptide (TPR) repeat protein
VIELKPDHGRVWYYRGQDYALLGNWTEAITDYERAVALGAAAADSHVWLWKGGAHGELGRWDLAVSDYSAAVAQSPDDYHHWLARGKAHIHLAEWDKATSDFSQAIQCDADAARYAIEILKSNGRAQEAESMARQAIDLLEKRIGERPQAAEIRIALGRLYAQLAQSDKAEAEFSKAIELNANAWEAWSGRAYTHLHRQQWDQAVSDFSKAVELAPDVHMNRYDRGLAYLHLSQWQKSVADLTIVAEQWPHVASVWYWRGVAHAHWNQVGRAIADLRQAVASGFKDVEQMRVDPWLNPLRSHEDFKKLLAELEKQEE